MIETLSNLYSKCIVNFTPSTFMFTELSNFEDELFF